MEIGPVFAARAERAREENRMSRMRSFAETHPELANQLGVTAEQQVGQNVEIDETPLVPVELENKTLASQPQALNPPKNDLQKIQKALVPEAFVDEDGFPVVKQVMFLGPDDLSKKTSELRNEFLKNEKSAQNKFLVNKFEEALALASLDRDWETSPV